MSFEEKISHNQAPGHVSGMVTSDDFDIDSMDWVSWANCNMVSSSQFLPTTPEQEAQAKAVCLGCLVVDECLEFASKHNKKGIWGGTNWQERQV